MLKIVCIKMQFSEKIVFYLTINNLLIVLVLEDVENV